jgi:hypothetical protein
MQKLSFNDNWTVKCKTNVAKHVTLPHDAMIFETRDSKAKGGAAVGYFPGGVYEYEKTYDFPEKSTLQFEGVYKDCVVLINGNKAGGCAYGYTQFNVAVPSGKQKITVIARNDDQPNSRWYTGSGIYRPVWLCIGEIVNIKVTTLSYKPAKIKIEPRLPAKVYFGETLVAEGVGEIEIPNAKLWSDESPNLYTCKIGDDSETFGIRLVQWSNKGLLVNGKSIKLRGGCVHHDNGILGAASFAKSEERRVRKLKEAGYNAIRSSHNPCAVSMLEACDRLGMYVIDETWDVWYSHKNRNDYATDFMANYKTDIAAMVDKDFNHPCVIMYSIANEVAEPAEEKGQALAKGMVDYIHSLDTNRAVTAGINLTIISRAAKGKGIYKDGDGANTGGGSMNSSLMFNIIASVVGSGMNKAANGKFADTVSTPVLDTLDIAGYNYASGRYPLEATAHPNRVIYGSETFPQDIAKNWAMVKKYPYLVGDFMWTAWDYLGEAGMGAWNYNGDTGFEKPFPYILADGGALDALGNPTGEALHAKAVWGLTKEPLISVRPVNHKGKRLTKAVWRGTNSIPSWSWKGCDGNPATVEVYADCYAVELLLNGKRVGKAKVKDCRAMFRIKYAPGELAAVSLDSAEKEVGRSKLVFATGKPGIKLTPEEKTVKVGDIVYIGVEIAGENGIRECNADEKLSVTATGGELLAFGSANPKTEESYTDGTFTTYYGKALAVVMATKAGAIKVSVSGGKYATASVEVTVTE